MRKTVVLFTFILALAVAGSGQTTKKHKPSAAVHTKSAQSTPSKTSAAPSATATQTTATPASTNAPAANLTGPVYEDEKQPLPAAKIIPTKTVTPTPSELPTGTAIRMKLETPLSSRENREGDAFNGRVTEPVAVRGRTVIPVGASITGRLLRVSDPRRFSGTGSMRLMPESVILPNGKAYAINASMVDTSTPKKLTVDDEGRIKSKGFSANDKIEMITGSGAGAIIGTIAGGGKGFLIGTMIGGGAAAVHWMSKKHPVEVPAGTELIMEINRPMTVATASLNAGE